MNLRVVCEPVKQPSWSSLADALRSRGLTPTLRMIDGELAFPDETPGENWRELRISLTGGMISMRRGDTGIDLVIWGNADAALRADWQSLAQVLAELSGGVVAESESA